MEYTVLFMCLEIIRQIWTRDINLRVAKNSFQSYKTVWGHTKQWLKREGAGGGKIMNDNKK